jgi:hypothetical protein
MKDAARLSTPALAALTLAALVVLGGLTLRVGLQLRDKTSLAQERIAQVDLRDRYLRAAARPLGERAMILDKATAGPAVEQAVERQLRAAGLPDLSPRFVDLTNLNRETALAHVKVTGTASAAGVDRWSREIIARGDTVVLERLTMQTSPHISPEAETAADLTVLVRPRPAAASPP